jgi:type I restriction enzyme, S subunit
MPTPPYGTGGFLMVFRDASYAGYSSKVRESLKTPNFGSQPTNRRFKNVTPVVPTYRNGIPASWEWVTVEEIALVNPGIDVSRLEDHDQVSFIPMKAVAEVSGVFDASETRTYAQVKKGYTAFVDGDLVIAKVTPCMENGKLAVVDGLKNGVGFGSTEFHVIRAKTSDSRKYLFHFMAQESQRSEAAKHMTGAVGLRRVPTRFLCETRIPFPPLEEQRRIVAKLESIFSKLAVGVRALERARTLLRHYRQSLLRDAVEGKLSEEWRAQQTNLEPASALLARVLNERREAWEARELQKMRAKGLEPLNDAWKARYEEPSAPDTSSLPSNLKLPNMWTWATVDQLSTNVQYGSSSKTNSNSDGVPVLRMGNIIDGNLDFDSLKFLPHDHDEFPELLLESRDILFNRTNSPELVGKTAVYYSEFEKCSFASYLIRVQTCKSIEPAFVSGFINSYYGKVWVASVAAQQVGQANVNGSKLKAFTISLPPLAEQHFIVSELERRFELLDNLEGTLETELKRASSLRQSVLHRAFTGRLVPQDPNDEPASALLERIRAERSTPPARRGRGNAKLKPELDSSAETGKRGRGRPRKTPKQEELF